MAKYKDRKTNAPLLLFGDAVEADAASRLATKYTWEGDILASPDALVSRPERGTLSDEWGLEEEADPVWAGSRLRLCLPSDGHFYGSGCASCCYVRAFGNALSQSSLYVSEYTNARSDDSVPRRAPKSNNNLDPSPISPHLLGGPTHTNLPPRLQCALSCYSNAILRHQLHTASTLLSPTITTAVTPLMRIEMG